jgi:hypothetical protein
VKYPPHAWRGIFARAERRLTSFIEAGDLARARQLVHEPGREALTESGDEVLLHRARPVDVPESEGIRGALPESLR